MPQLVEPTEPEAQREIIRQSLDELITEIGTSLHEAHLDFPVYITVPTRGQSLAGMARPLDPTDTAWFRATVIVCLIIEKRLGDVRLRGRALHCAVANVKIAATDVTIDTEIE